MGVVVLQIGQGGNQMGCALFQCLASMSASTPWEFFRPSPRTSALIARSILVDMEPKVIAAMVKQAKRGSAENVPWAYDNHRQVTQDSGAGNNWAHGYHEYGPKCQESIIDAVRLEVEECDMFDGFITMQSMAGGTGAGLGAYIVEALNDEFPSSFTLSHCIWPYESGEVTVQNYNVLLTLSHLQDFADGIIIVQNEQLSSICRSLLGIQRPSFDNMNDVAAQALASVLLPSQWRHIQQQPTVSHQLGVECDSYGGKIDMTRKNENDSFSSLPHVRILSGLLHALCAHPGYRMLTSRFTPQVPARSLDYTTFSWGAQLKHLRQMYITGAHKELDMDWSVSLPKLSSQDFGLNSNHTSSNHLIDHSIASLLVLRGRGSDSADVSGFVDERMYPIWSVDPLSVAMSPQSFGRYEMAIGLLSNCQSTIMPASRALSRGYNMYSARAYLHKYFEYGMEANSFDVAFATIEDVVSRYLCL